MKCAEVKPGESILDVCSGTGDIVIRFAQSDGVGKIVGIDLSEEMLSIARQKTKNKRVDSKIWLLRGNGLSLPFEDNSFDVVTIGFGLRNIGQYRKTISEMVRVLKEGGRLIILEFSPPPRNLFGVCYNLCLDTIIRAVGGIISGSASAYRYLSSSIVDFPHPEKIKELMHAEGLKKSYSKRLTWGIAYIHRGEK